MGISAARAREMEQGLSGIARKVYQNLSAQTAMTPGEVVGELRRMTGSAADLHIVQGCLRKLVEVGLARESVHDRYIRELVKEKAVEIRIVDSQPAAHVTDLAVTPEDPVEAIRRISGEIVERLDQIEGHAKALVADRDRAAKSMAKAAQLAELIKNFNV